MKYINYIFVTIVFIVMIVFVATTLRTKPVAVVPEPTTQSMCYLWNTEAGDSATLRLNITGDQVTGSFDFVPAEKDSKRGSFTGTISIADPVTMMRTVDGWWEASAEGMTVKEQLKVRVAVGTAQVGFGEMKDNGDNTYVYADPNNLSYEPTLQLTDCNDAALGTPSGKLPAGSHANGDVSKLTANNWVWEKTTEGAKITVPKKPGVFALSFATDGRVSGKTDCNGFGGSYGVTGTDITFGPFMSTLMYCEGSQEALFTQFMGTVKSYAVGTDGKLTLNLATGGSMTFVPLEAKS